MKRLTELQKTEFLNNGYTLFHQQVFSPEKFKLLNNIMEEHLRDKGEKLSDELDTPHFRDPRLFDFLLAEEALDLVEDLIGPNIGLWSSHFICKDPIKGRRTPWHEDTGYWNGRFDKMDKIVTLWVALDDTDTENGCMGVIPGTHTNGFSNYKALNDTQNSSFGEEIAEEIDLDKVVWFELKKGECSIHDGRIIHGANANTSTRRRCGYTMRYFSLDMKLNEDHPNNKSHKIYHARGNNIANNPLIKR